MIRQVKHEINGNGNESKKRTACIKYVLEYDYEPKTNYAKHSLVNPPKINGNYGNESKKRTAGRIQT